MTTTISEFLCKSFRVDVIFIKSSKNGVFGGKLTTQMKFTHCVNSGHRIYGSVQLCSATTQTSEWIPFVFSKHEKKPFNTINIEINVRQDGCGYVDA